MEEPSKDISEQIDPIFCDSCYNIFGMPDFPNFENDRLTPKDICFHIHVLWRMEPGKHGHIICSVMQFQTGKGLFMGEVQDIMSPSDGKDVVISNAPPTQITTVVLIESKLLHYLKSLTSTMVTY